MDEWQGGGTRGSAVEELILRTIAAHADSLLRTARRHSICVDDAQDAYQRALEIFMGHAQRLDPARAAGWLHVVVKREAQAIRRSRHKLLMSNAVDLDDHEADGLPTPEERLLSFDMVNRSAEALKRLKPHELRALRLRAQGHSYSDIGAITGWSYTNVLCGFAPGPSSGAVVTASTGGTTRSSPVTTMPIGSSSKSRSSSASAWLMPLIAT